MRVLLDTNIVLDVLQNRAPWNVSGQQIFRAAANRMITGCITAKEATDIHYFSRRLYRGQEHVDAKARAVISKLCSLFELLDTLAIDCKEALAAENGDYEDAVMIRTAVRSDCDCIVTRNPDDFRSSPIPVYAPDAFIKLLTEEKTE